MHSHTRDCLHRAAYCTQLAEAESDSEMKTYLLKLAASWTRAAQEAAESSLEKT
jgi:hypothetical protein